MTRAGALAVAVVAAVGLTLTARFAAEARRSLAVDWPITYAEGASVAGLLRVSAGEPLYQDFREHPHVLAPYTPLLYLLGGGLAAALELDPHAALLAARSVTLAASLALVLAIAGVARAAGARRLPAAAGATLFLALPLADLWGFAVRPDMLSLLLSTLAARALLRDPDRPGRAAGLAVMALLAKQGALALPVAAVLWLLASGRRPGAMRFALAWAALAGLCFAALDAVTGGAFRLNVIDAQLLPSDALPVAMAAFLQWPALGWLPIGLALLGASRRMAGGRRFLAIYGAVSAALALATLHSRGSDVNYLLEPAAVSCALAGLGLDALERRLAAPSRRSLVAAGLVSAVALAWGAQTWSRWDRWRSWPGEVGSWGHRVPTAGQLPVARVARARRPLAEEPLAVVLAGRSVVYSDPYHISLLAATGRFDLDGMRRRLERGEFDLIVLQGAAQAPRGWGDPFWPAPLRRAIAGRYRLEARQGPFWLYVPR